MGTWLRTLSGYRRYLQQDITFAELSKEYPQLKHPRGRGKIPDPWDDYPRKDVYDRSWKRYRKVKYRIKSEPKQARKTIKVTYDTFWVARGGRYVSNRCFCGFPFGIMKTCEDMCPGHLRYCSAWTRYRVRESYRRHRVDNRV